MALRSYWRLALLGLTLVSILASTLFDSSTAQNNNFPNEFDVRGADGVPKGGVLRVPKESELRTLAASATDAKGAARLAQSKALAALEAKAGAPLRVYTNALTGTPRHMLSHSGYLSESRLAHPEAIAREFLRDWKDIFRFSDRDLNSLKLKSRATVPDTGTTIMLFEQEVGGLPVYQGQVLVNVNSAGQIINVGGESFPQMSVTNSFSLSPEQAVLRAAEALNVSNFMPQSAGTKQVLKTFGNVEPEYEDGQVFRGGGVFTDDIVVTRTIFPMGQTGRAAYKFVLTTPQYYGIMWENVVDAETGEVLRRTSLTSFQIGGGIGVGRRGTFRPDVQDKVEAQAATGARGKTFDGYPTALSGRLGFGRSTGPGDPPDYQTNEAVTNSNQGRGFKTGQVFNRITGALIYTPTFGQVTRGFPDATNPSEESPFGWFYLPTSGGGAEVTARDDNRAGTRDYGYTMSAEAKTRNLPANSPAGDGNQPFSADVTPLGAPVNLGDGRTLNSVIQSRYTEGNNVLVADDHENDDESTHGVRGYAANRQFTAAYFDFVNSYEYGNVNATGTDPAGFPPSVDPDVYPAAVTLFYSTNLIHDYLYSIGFTESMWNFQQDNFGKGGKGGDGLSAQVHDGSGTNNANMGTQADGSPPRMQMYLWTEDGTRRADGDFDFDVVAHEYYHGVSNRSAGKGSTGCLGVAFFGESGGQGEGWSDAIAESMTDDDVTGEYVTGEFDRGIRQIPMTNFRWSYATINRRAFTRRDGGTPDPNGSVSTNPTNVPVFQVHHVGTVFAAILWDMRELMIVKDPNGVFFDGARRLGNGTSYYIGGRQVKSVDSRHPIDYRESFGTHAIVPDANGVPTVIPTVKASEHIVRPPMVAQEIETRRAANNPNPRKGPLATAVTNGGRLADTLVLRGLQLSPCNPSFVDTRDSILAADRELTGGENQAIIWRAFASHGVGLLAQSTNSNPTVDPASSMVPIVVEDFSVPTGVSTCEQQGPLPAPNFSLSNSGANQVTVTINGGVPVPGAATYVISRSSAPGGKIVKIAEIPATQTIYTDNNGGQGLDLGTYSYQVRATRNPQCVSAAITQNITVSIGVPLNQPAPIFAGTDQVLDPETGTSLIVSWLPAFSLKPNTKIVYDIYRVEEPTHSTEGEEPTFTPSAANRIAQGVTGTSYVDTNLSLAQAYYYIVRARDADTGKIDNNNNGNTLAKYNAPTVQTIASVVFQREDFENPSADARFTPPLHEATNNPRQDLAVFQRVENFKLGGDFTSDMMYAPDFSPGDEAGLPDPAGTHHGGQSDFSTTIGPFTNLTPTSVMEFDNAINAEAFFDGGVIEISVGDPSFGGNSVRPNNVTLFDAADYILEGRYNNRLTGQLPAGGLAGNPLGPRKAYTGVKGPHHVQITLNSFAPGRRHNPSSAPVYIRFRMTSDVASANGLDSGWFVDNLVVHNLGISSNPNPTPSPTPGTSPSPSPTPTATPTPGSAGTLQFSSADYPVTEACTAIPITVNRVGSTQGTVEVRYIVRNGTAHQRGDFTYAAGRLTFTSGESSKSFPVLISDDGYAEGTETATIELSDATGGANLGNQRTATLTINDNETTDRTTNPVDDAATFVCQHYHDFLNRQPDASGQNFWTNQITSCGTDPGCIDERRTSVSQAFFLSIEFQNTGYFVFRFYRASFSESAERPRGLPRYAEFLRDTQEIQRGVTVGQGNWEAQLEQNKQNFALDWVQRADFKAQFPESMSRDQYINQLFARSEVTPSEQERNQANAAYDSGGSLAEKRARGLRVVVETGSVYNKQYNPAFVLMQYIGYLRRNPNSAPDNNFSGYDFWLQKMNQFSQAGEDVRNEEVARGRVKRAEMVRSFIVSGEYRGRFGVGGDNTRGVDPNPTQTALLDSMWNFKGGAPNPLRVLMRESFGELLRGD